ncbi:MAG TPA: ribulose-phosphate 3-epimerase [bacterium]|nr:ribulose-phosphate 3-epimerase [bacterium]HOL55094.1 ribulose-phosphate 3-epimerase [bacterium]HPO82114.1 ribulose-phosphate 3-epimerase [bacterium]HRU32046.1 ribulose-phosphate 3-epimerase [bacterium]
MPKDKIEVSPSVMCMNFRNLEEDFRILENAGADRFHFDIMDGHFVPNITLGQDILRALRPVSKLPFEAHLMVENPERFIDRFIDADIITFHLEATKAPVRLARSIKELKKIVSVAINPVTPPELLKFLLCEIDEVLVMTVEPGFAGQKFIPQIIEKVRILKGLISRENPSVRIEVDGAISAEIGRDLRSAGAEIFVGGTSGIFMPDGNLNENLIRFKKALSECI